MAAAVAACTTRLRIGTAVYLPLLRHPVQVAEEAAIVDILSGGRLDLGFGVGYRAPEFAAFNARMDRRFADLEDHVVASVAADATARRLPVEQLSVGRVDGMEAEARRFDVDRWAPSRGGSPWFVLADVEGAIAYLRRMTAGVPLEEVYCWATLPGLPADLADRHVELLLTDVVPRLLADPPLSIGPGRGR